MPLSVTRRLGAVESKVSDLLTKARAALAWEQNQQNVLNVTSNALNNLDSQVQQFKNNTSSTLNNLGSRVDTLENNITSLALVTAPEVAQNSSALSTMTVRIGANEENIASLQGHVSAVQTDVATCARQSDLSTTNTTLTALTNRVTAAEGTLQTCALASALNTTNTNVTAVTNRVSAAETSITGANSALTALTGRVTAVEGVAGAAAKATDLSMTNTSLATTNANVTNLMGRVATAETNIANTSTALTSLTGRVASVETVAAAAAKASDLSTTNTNVNNLTVSTTSAQNLLGARVGNLENSLPTYVLKGDLNTTNSNVVALTSRVSTAELSLTSQATRIGNLESTSVNDIMRGWVTTTTANPLRNSKILSMAADPTSGAVLMIDAAGYVYRTYDGGATITQIYSMTPAATIHITFGNNTWVVCRQGFPVIYSTDGGTTWQTNSTIAVSAVAYNSNTNQWGYVSGFGSSRDINIGYFTTSNFSGSVQGTVTNALNTTGVVVNDMCQGGNYYVCAVGNYNAYSVLVIQNPFGGTTAVGFSINSGVSATSVAYSPAADVFVVGYASPGVFQVSGRVSSTSVTDMNAWSVVNIPDLIGVPYAIAYSGWTNQFVAAGTAGNKQTSVVYSANGTSWTPSYTYSADTRTPSSLVYDNVNDLWMMGTHVTGQQAAVYASVPYPGSFTHRKLGTANTNLKTLTANYNGTVSTVASNSTAITALQNTTAQLASGFCSSLTDNIYYAMVSLGPLSTEVNIEYHWTRVLDTVSLTGRVIIPGPVETTPGASTGYLKFKLPVAITGTFSSPGQVTYTYNNGTATSMTRFNPRLLGHVFMDNKAQQALIDNWEIYGEPGSNNIVTIYVSDNSTYSSSCFWFHIAYKLSPISYSTSITNQTTNTTPATI